MEWYFFDQPVVLPVRRGSYPEIGQNVEICISNELIFNSESFEHIQKFNRPVIIAVHGGSWWFKRRNEQNSSNMYIKLKLILRTFIKSLN